MITRKTISILSLTFLSTFPTGCATTEQRVLSGAAIGGGLGSVIGHQQGHNSKSRIVGASTGAIFGGLIGYFFKNRTKKDAVSEKSVGIEAKETSTTAPFLTRPKVNMYWEPDTIEGDKYIEKHRVWILKSSPTWTK